MEAGRASISEAKYLRRINCIDSQRVHSYQPGDRSSFGIENWAEFGVKQVKRFLACSSLVSRRSKQETCLIMLGARGKGLYKKRLACPAVAAKKDIV
jgi:hypothetical protein